MACHFMYLQDSILRANTRMGWYCTCQGYSPQNEPGICHYLDYTSCYNYVRMMVLAVLRVLVFSNA